MYWNRSYLKLLASIPNVQRSTNQVSKKKMALNMDSVSEWF